jgi:Protein of unknown function (DUF3574)
MTPPNLFALGVLSVGIAIAAEYSRSAATAPAPALSCRNPAHAMTRLEMLFGTTRPNGPPITDDEWGSFIDAEVTPRFPAGLTVLRGPGQWRERGGTVSREHSRILVIWYEPTSQHDTSVEAIRSAYKTQFDQESVMRVEGSSCVSF